MPHIAAAQRRAPRIVVFGEMVALLWRDGRHEAAVRLEELWNDLARKYDFSLFCAYPVAQMGEGSWEAVHAVCAAHSHAMPANVVALASEEKRLAEICDLERRGRALGRRAPAPAMGVPSWCGCRRHPGRDAITHSGDVPAAVSPLIIAPGCHFSQGARTGELRMLGAPRHAFSGYANLDTKAALPPTPRCDVLECH